MARPARAAERLEPSTNVAVRLAYAYRLGGFDDDALRVLPSRITQAIDYHLALGDPLGALEELREAVENEARAGLPLMRVKTNIWQDPVLDQPEFQELRDQLVFEE